MILTNVLTVLGILLFVFIYSNAERKHDLETQIHAFENMTAAAEQVTASYLKEEQQVCDVCANYINASDMTMEEAVRFIRASHINPNIAGHVIFLDDGSMSGLSTRDRTDQPGNNSVSYPMPDLFGDLDALGAPGEGVHISRAYTNPMNGVPSIAFYDRIHLADENDAPRSALLLRVIPLSGLESQ